MAPTPSDRPTAATLADRLVLTADGLVPAIVQQHDTGEVLMLAWMTPATLEETMALGETVFWSRSRGERWHKGATSGNTQRVVSIDVDCDTDVLLVRVDQGPDGVACHTGDRTCFDAGRLFTAAGAADAVDASYAVDAVDASDAGAA